MTVKTKIAFTSAVQSCVDLVIFHAADFSSFLSWSGNYCVQSSRIFAATLWLIYEVSGRDISHGQILVQMKHSRAGWKGPEKPPAQSHLVLIALFSYDQTKTGTTPGLQQSALNKYTSSAK